MDTNRKKVVVIALIVLTLVLGGLAVGISYYIQQNQAPDDSSAAVTCTSKGGACGLNLSTCLSEGGENLGSLDCGSSICCKSANSGSTATCTQSGGSCGLNTATCISEGGVSLGTLDCSSSICCKVSTLSCPSGTTDINGGLCACNNNAAQTYPKGTANVTCCPSGTTNIGGGLCACNNQASITVAAGSATANCTSSGNGTGGDNVKPTLTSCTATCNDVDGCNCTSGCQNSSVGNGASCGVVSTGSTGGNTSTGGGTTTVTKSQCGGSCSTDSDCAASASGAPVACRNGVCENTLCATGKTVPGANCACSTLNACGQACSASLGLCQAGSECGFIGSATSCTEGSGTQFCLPTTPGKGYTLTACSGIAAYNLRSPLGTNVTTQAQVLEACNFATTTTTVTTVVCGDGVCSNSESSFTCAADCTLPNTAVFSDRIDRIILGIIVIVLGISLAGGFDRLRKAAK